MITRAESRYIRISPRKFRQIIPLIKGMNPEDAIIVLASVKKKASVYAIELLKSVVANAKRMQGIDIANLYISRLVANGGPQIKRFRAASMGRAGMIRKRTSHIVVELDDVGKRKDPHGHQVHAHEPEPKKAAEAVKGKAKENVPEKTAKKRPVASKK